MFNNGPDYSSYTLDELFEAYSSIDKRRSPENFEKLRQEIAKNSMVIMNVLNAAVAVMKRVSFMPQAIDLKVF